MARIAFVTSADFAALTDDDRLAEPHLTKLGHEIVPAIWDDPTVSWDAFDALVVRSCWDYHRKTDAFLRWIDARSRHPNLSNPAAVLSWNLDKRYLLTIPGLTTTLVIEKGDPRSLEAIIRAADLDEVVVKPVVSMNGWDTFRANRETAPTRESEFRALVATRMLFVQRYLPEIETTGELSFLYLGGAFSHAIRKRPARGEFRIQEDYGGTRALAAVTPAQIDVASAMLAKVPLAGSLLYARVDVVESASDLTGTAFVPIEIEVIDPALFLAYDEAAPRRLARAIDAAVRRS